MIDKFIETIEKYGMVDEGDAIVVGFSGGPDSTALLHALWRVKDRYKFDLCAVHLNHMIRGDEALRDESFAEEFSSKLGIKFFSKRIDVPKYALENGLSSEEAGRELRYSLFDEIAEKTRSNKIALAHNLNDQAETILMRMLRGTGLTGLSGIKPVREGRFIRPLLYCDRKEIEEYCKENGLSPVIDSTNHECIYSRNKIRLQLIPYIEQNYNKNFSKNISKMTDLFRDEDEYLNDLAREFIVKNKEGKGISRIEFLSAHISIQRRVLRYLIEEQKNDLNGIEYQHIDECIRLIKKGGTGKRISLPDGLFCEIEYNNFRITKQVFKKKDYAYKISIPGKNFVPEAGIILHADIINKKEEKFSDTPFIKYYDYDKIKCGLIVRNRSEGDFIYPKGMKGCKKVKDLFIDKKIPREERDKIPVIGSGKELLWVYGVHDTGNYKPDINTKNILKLRIGRYQNG